VAGAVLAPGGGSLAAQDSFEGARQRMVAEQILQRGVRQPEVLSAMGQVPRHLFVPPEHRSVAYADRPIPIGSGQTISQPYIVALMTELLELDGSEKVLEIGTGSGYHAAVLSRVARQVFTIEILEELGRDAQENLRRLGYDNVTVRVGDGYKGWPEEAPFDAIILTAAPPRIPKPLIEQLRVGGRMVIPEGSFIQDLKVLVKTPDGLEERSVTRVRFLPMTGEVQRDDGGP
jgi:protein-L-isoaspartate(D-aspartate) O-methyltransferase